jgi:hypothetical protein
MKTRKILRVSKRELFPGIGEMLSFGEGRLMKHPAHLPLVAAEEQARLAEKAETQREHAGGEKAERRRLTLSELSSRQP